MPLQAFVFAFAALGPLHYLTEIAWLQRRQFYFDSGWMRPRTYALVAGVASVALTADFLLRKGWNFAVIAMLVLALSVWVRDKRVLAATLLVAVVAKKVAPATVFLAVVMVPTLVHVFGFTWLFMMSGALRARRRNGVRWVNPLLLLALPVVLLWMPLHYAQPGAWWLQAEAVSFAPLHRYIAGHWHHALALDGGLLQDRLVAGVLRVFAFVYLFHYLNWFGKTELLQWHQMPGRAWTWIGVLYALSVGLFAWNFTLGFIAANFLSMLHVLLEFPLDWKALRFVLRGGRERAYAR